MAAYAKQAIRDKLIDHFVTRPIEADALQLTLKRALRDRELSEQVRLAHPRARRT